MKVRESCYYQEHVDFFHFLQISKGSRHNSADIRKGEMKLLGLCSSRRQRFPAFSPRGTYKIFIKIAWHNKKNFFFADLTKK